jgi:hypothetical protein
MAMLKDYLTINLDLNGKIIKGFCMKIQDDYHLTYAVILEGCHSFCLWLDEKNSKWCTCKFGNLDSNILDHIIIKLTVQ